MGGSIRILVSLALLIARGLSGINQLPTMCYSPCFECSQSPSNCTTCGSSLVLVSNQCVVNSRESVLASQFFPINPVVGAPLSTKGLENKMYTIDNCTFTQTSTPVYFVEPFGPFERFYKSSQVPPHKFINVRFTFLQKDWTSTDFMLLYVNGHNPVEIARMDPIASPGGINCETSMTYVASIEYSFSDSQPTLNISFEDHLVSPAKYGINSLLVRYGNCHQSCDTCFGSAANTCETCKSFLQYSNFTCSSCDSTFFLEENACWKCDTTCLTCSNFGPMNCLSCNESESTLVNGSCMLGSKNAILFAEQFSDPLFTSNGNWTSTTGATNSVNISQCGRYSYIGGYQLGSPETVLAKTYNNLPPHFAVKIQLTMILIDSLLSSFDYQLTVNGVLLNATVQIDGIKTNECGQILTQSLSTIRTDQIIHKESALSLKFKPNISAFSHYGIRQVVVRLTRCGDGCRNCDSTNTSLCLQCESNLILKDGQCNQCPAGHFKSASGCRICNIMCGECNGPTIHECLSCDFPLTLNGSKCQQPQKNQIYGLYLNDKDDDMNPLHDWNVYPNLQNHGSDFCGDYRIFGNSQLRYRRFIMAKVFQKLPNHTGLTIHFFLHQIDEHTNQTVTLEIDGKTMAVQPVGYGVNVCGNNTRDAIRKVTFDSPNHTSGQLTFVMRVNQMAKVGLSNMLVFLKECERCHQQLTYSLDYLPVNNLENNKHGLQVWMEFNDKVTNMSAINSFLTASLGNDKSVKRLLTSSNPLNYTIEQLHNQSFKLFIPLSQSHLNAALTTLIDSASLVVNDRSSQDIRGYQKPLATIDATSKVIRFDRVPPDSDRRTIHGLHNFLAGLGNATLYVTMVLVLFGWSVITDDLIQLLQVLFIFIYIESSRLPISHSYPLAGLESLQFLDYLTEDSRRHVWKWFLPTGFHQTCPHVFQQYQRDVNFLRAIAARVILNICYLVLRVGGWLLFRYSKKLKEKSYNPYLRYLQNHHEKIFAFIDAVVRFEFLAIVWASLLQFTSFTSSFTPYSQINATFCILLFVGYMLHPAISFLFLKAQYNYMTNDQYVQLYSDSFYQTLNAAQTPSENRNPYLYLMFRYYRTFLVGLVVCLSATFQQPLVALVPLMLMFIGQIVWLSLCQVYTDKACLGLKLAENGLILLLLLLYIVVYGTADSMPSEPFLQLGYVCSAVVVLAVCNGVVRAVYLTYLRIKQFGKFKHNLRMQAIQNNNVNETEKQLVRSRTKQMIAGPHLSKANLTSIKKSIKSVLNTSQQPIGRQITSINRLIE